MCMIMCIHIVCQCIKNYQDRRGNQPLMRLGIFRPHRLQLSEFFARDYIKKTTRY